MKDFLYRTAFLLPMFWLALIISYNVNAEEMASSIRMDGPHYGDAGWEVSAGPGFYVFGNELFVGGDGDDDGDSGGFTILADVVYQNDNFYFMMGDQNGLVLGYSLFRNNNWIFDAVLGPKFGRPENDELKVLNERDVDLHLGLKSSWYGDSNRLSFELSDDITDAHGGSIFIVEYLHEWQVKNWVLTAGLGGVYASQKMVDYYFGVEANEATAKFPVYDADASHLIFSGLTVKYPITENWVFHSNISFVKTGSEVNDSPITQNDTVSVLRAGVLYRF